MPSCCVCYNGTALIIVAIALQASTSPPEAGGGYTARRGHVPQLSISDPSHHVTEAIGHMYDDDYDNKRDSRRLSYISSPLSESISIVPQTRPAEPSSPQSLRVQSGSDGGHQRLPNGQSQPSTPRTTASDSTPASPGSSDTANTSFPLNDIDYESDPQAVAQELNNLAAIRRMSMDVTATGDPDLPSFNFPVPSIAPSPSADENDTSRLFWVPARLHPELAPKEFKSFLESKSDHIKRRSGDFSSLSPDRQNSNSSLTRKRSMLSKQIDNGQGYTDGAERLERKRSQTRDPPGPNLHEIENLVNDTAQRCPSTSSLLESVQSLNISTEDDKPILPPAPPGHSLRRSTRTQYRKAGSLKKERPSLGTRRTGRASESKDTLESIVGSSSQEPILGLTRVSTDPTPSVTRAQALAKSQGSAQQPPPPTAPRGATFDSIPEDSQHTKEASHGQPLTDSVNRVNVSQQPRQWNSHADSNGRSAPVAEDQKIPEIVETPPAEFHATPSQSSQRNYVPPRVSSHDGPRQHKAESKHPLASSGHHKEPASTLNEFASNPQALPGNSTRTDSLSFIPTLSEDRKSDSKKSKDKKDSEGGRKSSWHWFLGSEDKDKEKKKDSDSKKIKTKLVDKVHDATSVLPASGESQRRESAIFDRNHDTKLEEERKKDNARRSSAEKKEKESGLFSSIFGGGRKKNNEHHHKKSLSRTLSPEPPVRLLQPDIDYPWTRFSILEERAIYRMAHIKLANPRRALYSQVLLSNFMYSYLAKVQQMHPHMMLASSASQRQQQKAREQSEEYLQYQRYQEVSKQATRKLVIFVSMAN